ncbi:type VII secretion protein EccB [Amycolatopsis sp. NBC_00438]|uniref:type VII secretion protein EccB n=1 Tax=Amycolatopsis sp. NBC_00438 TaxID=2903558 RepID=UPI002E2315D9
MASPRDQLHAHQFLVQRTVSALAARETDPERPRFRRPATAAFAGIGLSLLLLAGFGVFGLLVPGGNTSWQAGDAVIVEKETGTRFVYVAGRLHPAANYTSAVLAAGSAKTVQVSRNSLDGVPRGPLIGIAGAPDALPASDHLLGPEWSLCSRPETGADGSVVSRSVLLAGGSPAGGTPLGDRALLAESADTGERYLVAGGFRHRIAAADAVTVGLALRSASPVRLSPAAGDLLPAGGAIAPIPLPDAGRPSTAVARRPELRAGQLLAVRTSGTTGYYLAETGRLRPITPLQYDIQRAYPPTAAAYANAQPDAVPLSPLDLAEAHRSPSPARQPGDVPAQLPEFATGAAVCLGFTPGAEAPSVVLDPALAPPDPMTVTAGRTAAGAALADSVVVPPGMAALVEAMPSRTAPAGTLALVTDAGRAYPLASRRTMEVLGYGAVTPVRIPAELLARVPVGPGLVEQAALSR